MDLATIIPTLISGGAIGLILGLVGGGGSILAVPLLVYVVGIGSTHAAIGTAAVAVSANALASLVGHARAGNVKWRCASVFALAGVVGAAIGAELGKAFGGQRLLALFGLLMIGVGISILRKRPMSASPAKVREPCCLALSRSASLRDLPPGSSGSAAVFLSCRD